MVKQDLPEGNRLSSPFASALPSQLEGFYEPKLRVSFARISAESSPVRIYPSSTGVLSLATFA